MGDIDAMAVAMAAWRLAGRAAPGHRSSSVPGSASTVGPVSQTAGEPVFTLYTDAAEGACPAHWPNSTAPGRWGPPPRAGAAGHHRIG